MEIARKDAKDDTAVEVDLALFFREEFSAESDVDLVFVECKTYNRHFDEKDITAMFYLASNFPNQYAVFATLEKKLSINERKLIKRFLKSLPKDKSAIPRVMIFTGNELYGPQYPMEVLKEKATEIDSSPLRSRNNQLLRLCELTQRLYL